ncbi:MAG: CopG family transcriptional regulator [Thermofilum sp. ex4484_15]|nr:MAG: CopG family transcriptional regulator [Thermofilum sp. ex4484_15]
MGRKRRFGISVPEELAKRLDELAESMGINRSKLICEALEAYLHMYAYSPRGGRCCGVLTVTGLTDSARLLRLIEGFRDVVHEFSHTHAEGECVNILIVSGPTHRVAELRSRLVNSFKGDVRYLPLAFPT